MAGHKHQGTIIPCLFQQGRHFGVVLTCEGRNPEQANGCPSGAESSSGKLTRTRVLFSTYVEMVSATDADWAGGTQGDENFSCLFRRAKMLPADATANRTPSGNA